MKQILILLLSLFLTQCTQREIQLPQVSGVLQSEMVDYSVIYVFFNEENQEAELNANSLITSTHWVFHIDRRLTMRQAAEKIIKMQEKKEKPGMHNNPNSRNFFSVADMENKQLRFLEFTKQRFDWKGIDTEKIPQLSAITNSEGSFETRTDTVWVDGAMNFQDFAVLLYQTQLKGLFFTKIYVQP
ncbi:Conserved hypothetical protein [Capnocytophaga canimorsus Cc5]|uniref:Uncharacterized protein n=1 Tax=Capnocytophaga canimorsus (strain 5) TaxID=860228 RepID=F9YRY1_CAPCC|nr:hypothetical protein [Capnocytophaga canimorsus]AEK23782.1 Conserved hypothetical protein [Capnocytophaga canimorsus Cc5]